MKYIKIPETIDFVNLSDDTPTGRKFSFKEFLGGMLLDTKFGKTADSIFLIADLRLKLKEHGEPGDMLELSDGEWERLAAVIREPSEGYVPVVAMQIVDYLRAILDAPSKKPVEAAKG